MTTYLRDVLKQLYAKRVREGVCRHCGGNVPCWSEFGDRAVGKQHTTASLKALRKPERGPGV